MCSAVLILLPFLGLEHALALFSQDFMERFAERIGRSQVAFLDYEVALCDLE